MKKSIGILTALFLCFALPTFAQQVVLLHTNDTHSHIDAENGVGGVLQRKAMIDSIRRAEKNVLLIDAGDIVQGSLYFKLFRGEVEYPLMDMMGYDVQILGNHEFDNGLEELARYYKRSGAAKLAANYDFSQTPLKGIFDPYVIKTIGKKKIGILGIGLDPEGMIDGDNYRGMRYSDIIATANATAEELRRKGCHTVIAVTHIGYTNDSKKPLITDVELARQSRGIDIIIGGHSHEKVYPAGAAERPNLINNLDGNPVLIAQTGRYGANLGYIKLDLSGDTPLVQSAELLAIAGVDMRKSDKRIERFLAPYRHIVDSINHRVIARCDADMHNTKNYYSSTQFSNFISDIASDYATSRLDSIAGEGLPRRVDLAIMNCGGIRLPMKRGDVTEGQILSTFPFANHLVITAMSGEQLSRLVDQIASLANQGVSREVKIAVNKDKDQAESFLISGLPVDLQRTYYIATLDYLARGGDYLTEFIGSEIIWVDPYEWCAPMMQYVVNLGKAGLSIDPDSKPRLRIATPL